MPDTKVDWDVFVSYASEDRESVARPIRDILSALGVRVWFDETELHIGDSLRQCIDDGLVRSRYGVVILSKAFFDRHWPKQELNGLMQRESEGERIILPVWHEVTAEEVQTESPMLADKIAARTEEGILEACIKILRVVRPDIIAKLERETSSSLSLPRITTGRELLAITSSAHAYLPLNDEPRTVEEAGAIGAFLQNVQDWGDIADDIGADGRGRAQHAIGEELKELEERGFGIYAVKQTRRVKIEGKPTDWIVAAVAVLRGTERSPYLIDNQLFVDLPSDSDDSSKAT